MFHAIKTRVYFRMPTHPSFLTGKPGLIWCYCNNKLLMNRRKNKLLNGQTHINNDCSKTKPQCKHLTQSKAYIHSCLIKESYGNNISMRTKTNFPEGVKKLIFKQ